MKLLILGLLFAVSASASVQKLHQSIDTVSARVHASMYGGEFKNAMLVELAGLEASGLAGQKLSSKELNRLVFQEAVRPLLPTALSKDKTFINDLTGAVMDGKYDPRLNAALLHGIHLRPGFIDAAQLFDYFVGRMDCRQFDFSQANCEERATAAIDYVLRRLKIPNVNGTANLAAHDVKLEFMLHAFGLAANRYLGIESEMGIVFDKELKTLIKDAGLSDRWAAFPTPTCRRYYSSFELYPLITACRPQDKITLKDILP